MHNEVCFHICRLMLKQLVIMEVIQWTALWNAYKDEFENEKDKAAEDLRQRIIEHVRLPLKDHTENNVSTMFCR